MRYADAIKLAFQNLIRAKFRSFLTVLGVSIGISAIVAFVSIGMGLQKITSDQITSATALTTLTVTQKPASSTMEVGPELNKKLVDKIKEIPEVERVAYSISMPTTVESGGTSSAAIVYGIGMENIDLEITGITCGETIKTDNEMVVSSSLANSFSSNRNSLIGQTASVTILKEDEGLQYTSDKLEYKIVGVDNNDTAAMSYVPIEGLAKALGAKNYSTIRAKVKSRSDIDSVKNTLTGNGYTVTTIKDLIDQIDKVFLIIEIILGLIGSIGLIVSSLGIINTMTISFLERTREIGIMKAVGARGKDIKRLFVLEAAIIGFLGGIGGVLVAYGFGEGVNYLTNYFIQGSGQHIELFITPLKFSLIMVAVAVFISVFAGIYPTWRAQRLSPIEAIRQ